MRRLCAGALLAVGAARAADAPLDVATGLFDASQPMTLGLAPAPAVRTTTIFAPEAGDWAYNHAVALFPFKGRLYAQWQSSKVDEDASETVVVYASSADGEHWSRPVALTVPWSRGYHASGGWWSDGETLVAYLNAWPDEVTPRGGFARFCTSEDGETWSEPAPVTMADGTPLPGVIEQDPMRLASGRILNAAHLQPGLIAKPIYTDDALGVSGWRVGAMRNLPHESAVTRELEPSAYQRADGAAVMVFRDQASSHVKLAAVSQDDGETWSTPRATAMPDARTKQSAGNLPDGTAYLAGNPVSNRNRYPLVLVTSADGFAFDEAWLLRAGDDMQPLRTPGRYKREGFSYPKSVVWNEQLCVGYATNKEDVEMSCIPLSHIARNAP